MVSFFSPNPKKLFMPLQALFTGFATNFLAFSTKAKMPFSFSSIQLKKSTIGVFIRFIAPPTTFRRKVIAFIVHFIGVSARLNAPPITLPRFEKFMPRVPSTPPTAPKIEKIGEKTPLIAPPSSTKAVLNSLMIGETPSIRPLKNPSTASLTPLNLV